VPHVAAGVLVAGLSREADIRRAVNGMNNDAASGDSGNTQCGQRYWATNPALRPNRI